jgi:hypothetical protein
MCRNNKKDVCVSETKVPSIIIIPNNVECVLVAVGFTSRISIPHHLHGYNGSVLFKVPS